MSWSFDSCEHLHVAWLFLTSLIPFKETVGWLSSAERKENQKAAFITAISEDVKNMFLQQFPGCGTLRRTCHHRRKKNPRQNAPSTELKPNDQVHPDRISPPIMPGLLSNQYQGVSGAPSQTAVMCTHITCGITRGHRQEALQAEEEGETICYYRQLP